MPVYEYVCTVCGHTTEVIHGINAAGPAQCDECGGALRKLLSPPAIVFKGSGWAKKDARSSGARASRSSSRPRTSAGSETPTATASGTAAATSTTGSASAGDGD